MHGYGCAAWLIGSVLFVFFVVGVVLFIVWAVRQNQRDTYGSRFSQQSSSAENILKERYARGEISRDEYLSMLDDMKG